MEDRSRETLAHELWRLPQCPVEWMVEDRFGDPADFFQWDWLQGYRQHAADREARGLDDVSMRDVTWRPYGWVRPGRSLAE